MENNTFKTEVVIEVPPKSSILPHHRLKPISAATIAAGLRDGLPTLSFSLIHGVLMAISIIIFSALLFSRGLSSYIAYGIGVFVVGGLISQLVFLRYTGLRQNIITMQETPIILLAGLLGDLASGPAIANAPVPAQFAITAASIAITTSMMGLLHLLLGYFKLSIVIQWLPKAIITGFLAGAGALSVRASFGLMTGEDVSFALLQSSDLALKCGVGVLFGLLFLGLTARFRHPATMPLVLLAEIGLFYGGLWLLGGNVVLAQQTGWLTDMGAVSVSFAPLQWAQALSAHWAVIGAHLVAQLLNLFLIALVCTVVLLMNCTAIGLALGQPQDFNRELMASGLTNVLLGAVGCTPWFHSLFSSVLAHRMGVRNRWGGLVNMLVCVGILLFASASINYFPKTILGGLMFFIGLSLFVDCAIVSRRAFPPREFASVWVIVLVMLAFGLLPAVLVGGLMAGGLRALRG